jgi:hypothetical protein
MALTITKRCNRCRKPMRNDGTETEPIWVCNNPKCVKYVPPADSTDEENEDPAE